MGISISVLLPIIDETSSLEKTLVDVEASSFRSIGEYILIVCEKTTAESLEIAKRWTERDPNRYRLLFQSLPFLGGAMRDGFDAVRGSHVLVMSSDLETDPATVPAMLEVIQREPNAVVAASRWLGGARFSGYDPMKLIANKIFQKFFRVLYWTSATDLTFGFRILPMELVRRIRWEGIRHELMMETLVKPLRLGTKVIEVPTPWVARAEGESHNSLFEHWRFFYIGFKTRFASRSAIVAGE